VPGVGIEPTFTAFQTVANPSQLSRRNLVDPQGIEPCRLSSLQGKRPPHAVPGPVHNLVAGVGVEPTYEAYETSDWAASLTRNKLGPGSSSRTSSRSIIGRVLCHLSFSWMEPADGIEPMQLLDH
jgi:hypothetical protein